MDAELNLAEESRPVSASRDEVVRELEQVNAQLAAALRAATGSEIPRSHAAAADILIKTQIERDRLAGEVAELKPVIDDLRGRVAYLETALAATESSFSWKVTRPLRAAKSRFKRGG